MSRLAFVKPSWMEWAACKTSKLDFFSRRTADIEKCVALCNECAVQDLCADYAMDEEIAYGVWGGLTERERKNLAKMRATA